MRSPVKPSRSPSNAGGIELAAARRAYAEELRYTAHLRTLSVVAALATVPRENFVGPGPWRIKSPMDDGTDYWTTENDDPRSIYHDVLVALDEARGINNGQPQLWGFLLDQLGIRSGDHLRHLGCGTGYYTAVMAELVGLSGKVDAIELDERLARRAQESLRPWPNVSVQNADGAALQFGNPVDVIVASAGLTNPPSEWFDALKVGGRLLCPLTSDSRWGAMLLVVRPNSDEYTARFLASVGFIAFEGGRNAEICRSLAQALTRDRGGSVKSLRRDLHPEGESCWLHGNGWCLSIEMRDSTY